MTEYILHIKSRTMAKILEKNDKYGWVKVQFPEGKIKYYDNYDHNDGIRFLTKKQRADILLDMENSGRSTNWRED